MTNQHSQKNSQSVPSFLQIVRRKFISLINNRDKYSYHLNPFLLTLFPILFVYSRNLTRVTLVSTLRITGFLLLMVILLNLLILQIIKNKLKTSILLSIYLFIFYSYGHIVPLIPYFELFKFNSITIGRNKVIFPLLILLIIFVTIKIIKTKKNLLLISKTITYSLMFLVAINLTGIIYFHITLSKDKVVANLTREESYIPSDTEKPDIYYLIFDAHTNNKSLQSSFNYDDQTLAPYLTSKGFFVTQNSSSNYVHTIASLASSLNMDYNQVLTQEELLNGVKLTQLIDQNLVARNLKDIGYEYLTFNSGFHLTEKSTLADTVYDYQYGLNHFEQKFIPTTILFKSLQLVQIDLTNLHRARINSMFATLKEVSRIPQPTFTFAHFLSPHPPFVFDDKGNTTTIKRKFSFSDGIIYPGTGEEYSSGYLNQLKYIDKRIVETIDYILKHSDSRPIIIIQGDHGSASGIDWSRKTELADIKRNEDKLFNPDNPKSIEERTSILNAYYFPGETCKNLLYDTITPVNSFRLVFDCYFGTNLGLLEDKTDTHY